MGSGPIQVEAVRIQIVQVQAGSAQILEILAGVGSDLARAVAAMVLVPTLAELRGGPIPAIRTQEDRSRAGRIPAALIQAGRRMGALVAVPHSGAVRLSSVRPTISALATATRSGGTICTYLPP